jgi:hypothetical protein
MTAGEIAVVCGDEVVGLPDPKLEANPNVFL